MRSSSSSWASLSSNISPATVPWLALLVVGARVRDISGGGGDRRRFGISGGGARDSGGALDSRFGALDAEGGALDVEGGAFEAEICCPKSEGGALNSLGGAFGRNGSAICPGGGAAEE